MKKKRFITKARRLWLDFRAFIAASQKVILSVCQFTIPVLMAIATGIVIYDFGYKPFWSNDTDINLWLQVLLEMLVVLLATRMLLDYFNKRKPWVRILNAVGWLFIVALAIIVLPMKEKANISENDFLVLKVILYSSIVFTFIIELSYLLKFVLVKSISPAALFVASFFLIIIIGAFLLKLPNATNGNLSAVDAFFTSTSAVCVTGLVVVDTATHFTNFGKLIILLLIQIGGLGIMTFAGLFAFAVTGASSLKSRLTFGDLMHRREMGNVMRFLGQVVVVTFLFEIIGAICIYVTLPDALFVRGVDKIFFAVFHAVSAFCNAGFSTLSNGLYEAPIRYNYTMQFFIAILVILGGMGFPIVFNLSRYFKVKIFNFYYRLTGSGRRLHFPRLLHLNSRLALVVSFYLLAVGFLAYYFFEMGHSLRQHDGLGGKIITSFFGSVTPRTAGFNTVDMSTLSMPMIMIYLLLMWIGASPGSTGGGIKTTTFGVALLNMMSTIRGKDRTEVFRSEISFVSIRRAFTLIFLSLLFIGLSVFFISINDADKGLVKIAFEAFSAFGTVGLSLGITSSLSTISKVTLMITMFVGRVGTVTLMAAFIRQSKHLYYRYPKEEISF